MSESEVRRDFITSNFETTTRILDHEKNRLIA
jgi:hypothetical protein